MFDEVVLWNGLYPVDSYPKVILPFLGVMFERSSQLPMATLCPLAPFDLGEYAQRNAGRLSLQLLLELVLDMFLAVDLLHNLSPPVCHCNPTTKNWLVFLDPDGKPSLKLGDFMCSRRLTAVDGDKFKLQRPAMQFCPPEFDMVSDGSPQVEVEHVEHAFALDIYCVGVTVCNLVNVGLRGVRGLMTHQSCRGLCADAIDHLKRMDTDASVVLSAVLDAATANAQDRRPPACACLEAVAAVAVVL